MGLLPPHTAVELPNPCLNVFASLFGCKQAATLVSECNRDVAVEKLPSEKFAKMKSRQDPFRLARLERSLTSSCSGSDWSEMNDWPSHQVM